MRPRLVAWQSAIAAALSIASAPCAAAGAAPTTLACAVSETITGTNGRVEHRQLRQFLRIDAGLYEIWEGPGAGWSANLCDVARCSLSGGVFQLQDDYASKEDGQRLSHQEERTVDLRSGRAASRVVNGATQVMTGREAETTTYDDGDCALSSDPEGNPSGN